VHVHILECSSEHNCRKWDPVNNVQYPQDKEYPPIWSYDFKAQDQRTPYHHYASVYVPLNQLDATSLGEKVLDNLSQNVKHKDNIKGFLKIQCKIMAKVKLGVYTAVEQGGHRDPETMLTPRISGRQGLWQSQ
jgi:hypothetical protein